ncbi:transcriptional regulator [Subtercola sp. Z020]|uniref:GAF and ANTAR domain-containing protein n=1 Tax=Subtercola sp. Z020 TaxID=2080582 RepID=UPI000CE7599B|nr:GAF and ANTAR domain-containing protein [Subtercola sp. Z020]PPF77347.1 transcriptional regulator [Subtercola sp. Z020]
MAESTFEAAAAAITDIDHGADPARIAEILLSVVPMDGGAVSTLGNLLGAETISATSLLAARIDEVQFDLGEGPCWDALASRRPVLEPDFAHRIGNEWPLFTEQVRRHRIGALFAFPLTVGPMQIGAIDFYTVDASALTSEQIAETSLLAAVISRVILRRAIRLSERDLTLPETEYSRRVIHQATGIIVAQLRLPPDDALLILRGRAFASGRSMMDIATDIVERRVSFSAGPNGIEDTP